MIFTPLIIHPMHPILINGSFRASSATTLFTAFNPTTRTAIDGAYPVSSWSDIDAALDAATSAFEAMLKLPRAVFAAFLENYAAKIESNLESLAKIAHEETGLPFLPRLRDVEGPRTVNQLRLAAAAARSGAWSEPVIDTKINLRACLGPIGPVVVLGPNNFPFAYNGIAGGDFAAAIAAGNPVIAKAHPSHPGTSLALARLAQAAADETGLPKGAVQMLFHLSNEDGLRLMGDSRTAALGFTGSRTAGMALKAACDGAGKTCYLEMSSVNPVVILPGALRERGADIAKQYTDSCLLGAGQFCTNPGIVFLVKSPEADAFLAKARETFEAATPGTLLSEQTLKGLAAGVAALQQAGAQVVCGGAPGDEGRYCFCNTLLTATGAQFIANAHGLQTEAFGNAGLVVVCDSVEQVEACLRQLEGNLTGCVYSDTTGKDDAAYVSAGHLLRQKVGRLINDKMPTGVAVSAAMNHGGPYPATGHPGFSAVGVPVSLKRFAMLQSFDSVREHRLPDVLRDSNPTVIQRLVDGRWTDAKNGAP